MFQKNTKNLPNLTNIIKYFKGLDRKRWYNSSEILPKQIHKYPFEDPQKISTKNTRIHYESPVNSFVRARFKHADFRKYQAELESAAQRQISGQKAEQQIVQEVIQEDPIYGKDECPQKYYDRPIGKELYFNYRSEINYFEYADRKINFLEHFNINLNKISELSPIISQIYKIAAQQNAIQKAGIDQQFIIEDDFYKNNEECINLFDQIKQIIPKLHFKQLPDLGLALSFKLRYNKDIFGIWAMIENMFRESLHHYSTLELARMKYGSCTIFPKSFSLKTSKAINDIVFNELHNVRDMNELIHILHAFRNVSSLQNYNKLIEEICKRTLKNTLEAVHLLFVFSHAKYPNYKRKLLREKDQDLKEQNKIIDFLANMLSDGSQNLQGDDIVRVLIGLNNLKCEYFKDVLHNLEQNTLKSINSLDAFQTSNILYGFSKSNNNTGFGSENLYRQLQKQAEKHWKAFSNIQKAHTFYALASQDLLDKQFRQNFIQTWLNETLENNLNFQDLHYVAFSLVYEQNKDEEIWKKFVKNIQKQKNQVPVPNYYPIKLAKYYIQSLYPDWNLDQYKIACLNAENQWNVSRQQNSILKNESEFKKLAFLLQNKLNIEINGLEPFENLYLIDWLIKPQKIAILVQGEHQSLSNGKMKPSHRMKIHLLEHHSFAVINIVFKEFENIIAYQKVEYLEKLLQKTIEKQQNRIKDIEEPQMWLKFMDDMQERAYNSLMVGQATRGGKIHLDEFDVSFDWSKLKKEFKERSQ